MWEGNRNCHIYSSQGHKLPDTIDPGNEQTDMGLLTLIEITCKVGLQIRRPVSLQGFEVCRDDC